MIKSHRFHIIYTVLLLLLVGAGILPAAAVTSNPSLQFADNSKLSSGRWVKIGVTSTGMHKLTFAQLKSMGFSNPSKVLVYGYGGARLPETLTTDTGDDLTQVPSLEVQNDGILFYATGPVSWAPTTGASNNFVHSNNPFTDKGYYFITDSSKESRINPASSNLPPHPATYIPKTFREHITIHEERNILGESGFSWFGQDLKANPNANFNVSLPGLAKGEFNNKIWTRLQIGAKASTYSYGYVTSPLSASPAKISVPQSSLNGYDRGRTAFVDTSNDTSENPSFEVRLEFKGGTSLSRAFFHFLDVTYERELKMTGDELQFRLRSINGAIANVEKGTVIMDVTNPAAPFTVLASFENGTKSWSTPLDTNNFNEYVAFNPAGKFPAPTFEGVVANQNLHAMKTPDMVIFTLPEWKSAADRLAEHRRTNQKLDVAVVNVEDVYREFASGSPDVQAFRKMLRMFYERNPEKIKYVLFFGRAIWDIRRKSAESTQGECAGPAMPSWQTQASTNQYMQSYMTDDLFGFLDTGTSSNDSRAAMKVAVGRLPITSLAMADEAVDKIIAYERSEAGPWRGNFVIVTDTSRDASKFIADGESTVKSLQSSGIKTTLPGVGYGMTDKKIYLDAYHINNGQTTEANEELQKSLRQGASWLAYVGHSSQTAWGDKGIMPFAYASTMSLRRKPIVVAGTCEYAQFDGSIPSGGEAMWRNAQGPIAVITATRPAGIIFNSYFMKAVGTHIGELHESGRALTVGEVLQRAKNDLAGPSAPSGARTNALVYVLIGDPAMPTVMPSTGVNLTQLKDNSDNKTIYDASVDNTKKDPLPAVKGGSEITVTGELLSPLTGALEKNFNGKITVTLLDALHDETSNGLEGSNRTSFTQQGGLLTTVTDVVKNGKWSVKMRVPNEIANNNTPAAISMYAVSDDNKRHALGSFKQFAVSGFSQTTPDKEPPVIKNLYLNYPGFKPGDIVDSSPTLYAHMSDNVSINLSSSGVGRGLTLTLDDNKTYADLAAYFTPDFGTTASGSVAYQLRNLPEGKHKLTLTVWDTSDNMTQSSINFRVDPKAAPSLVDVYTDANPATSVANFFVTHDRPDQDVDITIEVFDINGRNIWSRTRKSYSEGNVASPITWDLKTSGGTPVSSGLYIYRATVAMPGGEQHSSKSRKLAVTPH